MGNRYIDADALAKVLNITEECKDCAYHWGTHNGGFFCGKSSEFANACEAIFDAPTADVVEVVRCKECKHHDGIRCFRWNSVIVTGFDDFCSEGERRDNG